VNATRPCLRCGYPVAVRQLGKTAGWACPDCGDDLPARFGRVRSHPVALAGARGAGKTVFTTVLVHELMHRVGNQIQAAITGADDDTIKRFTEDYENPLYQESRLPAPTPSPGHQAPGPLVFRFTTAPRRAIRSPHPRHTLLSFFDSTGEELAADHGAQRYGRRLRAAGAIVLLVDPLQLPSARGLAGPDAPAATGDAVELLERITAVARVGGPAKKLSQPLAIALTKLDLLSQEFSEASALRRLPPAGPRFDEADSQEVHLEIRRLLTRWGAGGIDDVASGNYRRYRYFGLSALGGAPTSSHQASPHGIRPYRVADPFLWLFGRLSAGKTWRGP
jgi:predicted RNA-binding Zn-ribbon protein involved in translation (DUF1610 family)